MGEGVGEITNPEMLALLHPKGKEGGQAMKREKYPICLTCYSIMVKAERKHETECRYYCPVCKNYKGLTEVWGFDSVVNRIRATAKEHNINPIYAVGGDEDEEGGT